MNEKLTVKPIAGFEALDGCHCVTASLKKICAFYGYDIREEMLLGLGAGVGFIYWHQKGTLPFLGGRGNVKNFFPDISDRTGIKINVHATTSKKKAERELAAMLKAGQPVMIYGDMGYLPYFDFGEDYHFGEHAVVVGGYDAASGQVLIADVAPKMPGLKKGRFYQIALEQLSRARGSTHKPFPPKNRWFTFDFSHAKPPDRAAIYNAIAQMVDAMLNPPIKNMGAAGITTAANRIRKWPQQLDEETLKAALFNVYVFVEIGGTGGGIFRYMYSRFLEEAAEITGNPRLKQASKDIYLSGERWSELAQPFEKVYEMDNPAVLLPDLISGLRKVARMEEEAMQRLKKTVTEACCLGLE